MNLFDPGTQFELTKRMRQEREAKGAQMRLLTTKAAAGRGRVHVESDRNLDARWRSYFRFEGLAHRHLERPAYI